MRARAENIEVISEVHGWVASLTKLAESIDCAAATTNQLAPDKS
jgi:hypothetical protein